MGFKFNYIDFTNSLIIGGICPDCRGDRIIMLSTRNQKIPLHLAKCIDCGAIAVNAENDDLQKQLVIFVTMLQEFDSLKTELSDEIIDLFFSLKWEMEKNVK